MAQNILFNGVVYSVPDVGDDSWGQGLSNFFIAIPQGALQKSAGLFTLTANANFGANFGLLAAYFMTRGLLPSTAGLFRLNVTDTIGWRNNANGGNLLLGVNASDQLVFNGTSIISNAITALTGDVTATGPGSVAATIAANAVSNAKFRQSVALSLVGNSTNATANVADIVAGTDHFVLVRAGTALAFALLLNSNIDPAAAIDFSKLAALTAANILVGSAGNVATSVAMSGDITIGNTGVTAIGVNKVLNTMLRQGAALSIIGRSANSLGDVADISAGTDFFVLRRSGTSLAFGLLVAGNLDPAAAIAFSQLAALTSGNILVGSSGNVPTSVAMSGDITISNLGVVAIGPNKVTNAMLATAASAATASYVALRDANANLLANSHLDGYATTATAAGTTTLTVASAKQQFFTGSTTQTVALPVASTLALGQQFQFVNNSSGVVTIQSSGANTVQAMAASSIATVTCILTSGTSAASWNVSYSTAAAGGGSVTSVAMTVPTALFATSPVTGSPITTSGTLAPTLATQTAGTFFAGPTSGSAATPTFRALQAPTRQIFTSGSGTYTKPAGVLWLRLRMVGAGGGGSGSGTSSSSSDGGSGANSTFGSSSASGGVGGTWAGGGGGGAGGGGSVGDGSGFVITGGSGGGIQYLNSGNATNLSSGEGGNSVFGGGGGSVNGGGSAGLAGATNSGGGGSGGGFGTTTNLYAGEGGGAGGYLETIISSPAATYSYSTGGSGPAGNAGGGAGANAGGAGGSGVIIVEEFYQ